jgi:hypothetical protein
VRRTAALQTGGTVRARATGPELVPRVAVRGTYNGGLACGLHHGRGQARGEHVRLTAGREA